MHQNKTIQKLYFQYNTLSRNDLIFDYSPFNEPQSFTEMVTSSLTELS